MFDPETLRTLYQRCLPETGSFSKAAERLSAKPRRRSYRIKLLENTGVPGLFFRTTRSVVDGGGLTPLRQKDWLCVAGRHA